MKTFPKLALALVAASLLMGPQIPAATPSDQDALAVARSVIKADRQATVAQAMQLTEAEGQAFWPLHHKYRVEMFRLTEMVALSVEKP